jgi:O-antigen/teichoic acid export membrane protein
MIKLYLHKLLGKIRNSEYSKNILSVFSANAIAQFLPLLTAPILTRIYTPEDYGFLGILISINTIINVFSTMGYANAIVISDSEDEALNVVALSIKCTMVVTCISIICVLIFAEFATEKFNIQDKKYIIYLVPSGVFFTGISTAFSLLINRYKLFKMLSINKVLSALITAVVSIALGLIFRNVIGLIIGFMLGQFFNSVVLYITLRTKKTLPGFLFYLKAKTSSVAKKFKDFPKFVLASDFINNFSNQMPVFLISSYATNSKTTVGYYNMSNRILGMPITLLSGSIGEVFKQRAAEDFNTKGSCRPIFIKTLKTLTLFAIVPFTILVLFGGEIFAIALGEKWRSAGHYSQILGIMFFFRFIISPLTYIFYVAQKQKLDFLLHLLFIVFGILSFYIGIVNYKSVELSLQLFAGFYSILYLIYLFLSYKLTINKRLK